MNDWFKDWFSSGEYHNVYKHRDSKDAILFWDTFTRKFELPDNVKVLDAACGPGRYSSILAEKNIDVTGFDLAMPLLKIAYQKISKKGKIPKLLRTDIREATFRGEFDLILNMFTSFGYFESDDENFLFLKNARDFLTDKGVFVLDYLNQQKVLDTLVPESSKIVENKEVFEKRFIRNGRVEKEIVISDDGENVKFIESVKLYDKNTLVDNINSLGYNILDIWGGYGGEAFDGKSSERLIILFGK